MLFIIIISHFTFFYQTGWSSLTLASQNGHVEVVDKLLQHGARVDLQDEVGFTNHGNHSLSDKGSLVFVCVFVRSNLPPIQPTSTFIELYCVLG